MGTAVGGSALRAHLPGSHVESAFKDVMEPGKITKTAFKGDLRDIVLRMVLIPIDSPTFPKSN